MQIRSKEKKIHYIWFFFNFWIWMKDMFVVLSGTRCFYPYPLNSYIFLLFIVLFNFYVIGRMCKHVKSTHRIKTIIYMNRNRQLKDESYNAGNNLGNYRRWEFFFITWGISLNLTLASFIDLKSMLMKMGDTAKRLISYFKGLCNFLFT